MRLCIGKPKLIYHSHYDPQTGQMNRDSSSPLDLGQEAMSRAGLGGMVRWHQGSSWRRGKLSLSSGDTTWWHSQRQHQRLPMDPLCTASSGPRKKRPRQVGASMASPPHDIKFQNLVLFILEKKMGTTRRNFLMELARRKGFRVENELR